MTSSALPPTPDSDRATRPAAPAPSTLGPSGRGLPGINRNVFSLGLVSLFTDLSSEMIIPVLPLFVTTTLRGSVASVGLIEGVAECASALVRVAAGWLSDHIGRRKPFLLLGYGVSTVAKAAMALATSWPAVLGLRFSDRLGKGLRNPPRDALIADSVEPRYLGRAFGFHRALDTLGAALGPLAAFLVLRAFPGDFRRVFLLSALPALVAIAIIAVFVRAPRHETARRLQALPAEARSLGGPFARFLVVTGLFSLASSSVAFLLLRSRQVGFAEAQVPLIYLGYNLVYALLSWPVGEWSDRIGRRPLLMAAYLLFAALYAVLAWASQPALVAATFVALGIHSALIEATQRSFLADLVPPDRRATAFGFQYAVVGLAVLPGNALAGWVWDRHGAKATFGLDAALALVSALLFVGLLPRRDEMRDRHREHAA